MTWETRRILLRVWIIRRFWLCMWHLFWIVEDGILERFWPEREKTRLENRIWPFLLLRSGGHL